MIHKHAQPVWIILVFFLIDEYRDACDVVLFLIDY